MQKIFIFVKKNENKYVKDKKHREVRFHCREMQRNIVELRITYLIENIANQKITIYFHNGSNYDYHFIIKDLAENFKETIYLLRRKH